MSLSKYIKSIINILKHNFTFKSVRGIRSTAKSVWYTGSYECEICDILFKASLFE